jgi:FdhE protein
MVSREERRIRAKLLARKYPESAHLLEFYVQITLLQDDVAARIPAPQDATAFLPRLRELVEASGPAPLVRFARERLNPEFLDDTSSEEAKFFARILLQPYAEHFRKPLNEEAGPNCPSCGSKPVVGVLRGEGEGAKRALICSLCALEWPYRRLICANCGEEDKEKLPVYTAAQIAHVRVEACDTCHTYLKSVDLTKDGFAVPQVDEIATVALNLWAEVHEYSKMETNLLGM